MEEPAFVRDRPLRSVSQAGQGRDSLGATGSGRATVRRANPGGSTFWYETCLVFLIGVRNLFVVMFEWSWAYWTWQRSNRVILQRAIPPSTARDTGETHESE